MTSGTEPPESIVSDAEPLIAYFCDDPGSDTVEAYVEAVEGAADGYISAVTLAEVHYIVRATDGEERADAVVDVLEQSGISRVDTEHTWPLVAEFKFSHAPALGDAFALGTAAHVDGTLLVGADDDYDSITEVPITRFRTEPA
ncbi:PIN domain-containing protein [Halorubrum sp. PV6]|uniref:PIN domain-containing protein n=1 Tax=Halorubrum sp. PV6 TaxID=634157 RepID=UPI000F8586AA|nr:PIN domain-containing protein [Halorubrum sp. PV6]AZQ14296.1 type II toxin-antitoxin system VapC family toxin [Halorubrum sp. PV6]